MLQTPKSIKKSKMSESSSSAGDGESGNELWAPFPSEVLTCIVSRLTGADHAALRSTCNSWRAVFSTVPAPHHPNPLPFLLLPPRYALPDPLCLSNRTPPHPPPPPDYPLGPIVPFPRLDHGHTDSPFFPFDSLRNPAFRPLPALSLPDTDHSICIGSSHGWLILLGPTTQINLVNPLTARGILLTAPLSSVRYAFPIYDDSTIDSFVLFKFHPRRSLRNLAAIIRVAALSADPTNNPSFLLVLVLGNTKSCRFFTCGPSDRHATWTPHPLPWFPAYGVTDLIFHHGLCFAAVMWHYAEGLLVGPVDSIAVFDFHVNPSSHRLRNIFIKENHPSESYANFFIESAGELLLISRHGEITAGGILVHRLPPLDGVDPLVSTPLASIGDRALFLGTGNTVAVHTPDFPLFVRRNSIYFTDVFRKVVNNQVFYVGCVYVFDMEQGVTTKAFEVVETDELNMWTYLRPWWVTPNLRRRSSNRFNLVNRGMEGRTEAAIRPL